MIQKLFESYEEDFLRVNLRKVTLSSVLRTYLTRPIESKQNNDNCSHNTSHQSNRMGKIHSFLQIPEEIDNAHQNRKVGKVIISIIPINQEQQNSHHNDCYEPE